MSHDKMIEIIAAHRDGKIIQSKYKNGSDWWLVSDKSPATWDWGCYDYRIKPEPKLRPWTRLEVPLGVWLHDNSITDWCACEMICRKDSGGNVEVGNGRGGMKWVAPQGLFDEYKHSTDGGKTWKICGVEESC